MPSNEQPSYSSSRVQRATRINSIEAVRLQQQIQCIEKAMLHQCRLANQDIRLVSMSLDYIQSSSGHSAEAWRPAPVEEEEEEGEGEDGHKTEEDHLELDRPCFMYGERIMSRKRRRLTRPMSAMERHSRYSSYDGAEEEMTSVRPQSSPSKPRPVSAMSWFNVNRTVDHQDVVPVPDDELDKMTSMSSRPSSCMTGRVTPHQDWEDDTSEITKKIWKAQARAQSREKDSVFQSGSDVMTAKYSRGVRGLVRKIRLSSPMAHVNGGLDQHSARLNSPGQNEGLGRRATLGEILNQRRPTLSAGEWRSHLRQTSTTPMSTSRHREMMLDAKKRLNNTRAQDVKQKVHEFMNEMPGRSGSGRKTVCR